MAQPEWFDAWVTGADGPQWTFVQNATNARFEPYGQDAAMCTNVRFRWSGQNRGRIKGGFVEDDIEVEPLSGTKNWRRRSVCGTSHGFLNGNHVLFTNPIAISG